MRYIHCVICNGKFGKPCVRYGGKFRRDFEWKNLCTYCGEWAEANSEMPTDQAWWKPLAHRNGCSKPGWDVERRHNLKALKLAAQDGGVYLIRGAGMRRYVGETVSFAQRRHTEIMLGFSVRLIKRMPGSTKFDRRLEEARISELLISKDFIVLNRFKKPVMCVSPR